MIHRIELNADEVRNELNAIKETGASVKQADLRYTLENSNSTLSLKNFRNQLIDLRNGDVDGKFSGLDLSYDKAIREEYGVDFKTFNRALGIKTNSSSFAQVGKEFGTPINSFDDLFSLVCDYTKNKNTFSQGAPVSSAGIDSSLTWIIPETILQYIRLGIDSSQMSKQWIATTTSVRSTRVIQPYMKPSDSRAKVLSEGEKIPMGSVQFGQRDIALKEVGIGIEITKKLQMESTIDVVANFLQEVGNDMSRQLDYEAFMTILNGDQPNNSGAAPVIGVTTAGTLLPFDIDRVMSRMGIANQKPNVILLGEDMYNLDLNATMTNRERLKISQYASEARTDLFSPVTENQAIMLNKQRCLIELLFGGMTMEEKYEPSTRTSYYYLSRFVGFGKLRDDAAVVLDKSIAFNGFPPSMDYSTLWSGFATK